MLTTIVGNIGYWISFDSIMSACEGAQLTSYPNSILTNNLCTHSDGHGIWDLALVFMVMAWDNQIYYKENYFNLNKVYLFINVISISIQ